jgi:hypothetical protein
MIYPPDFLFVCLLVCFDSDHQDSQDIKQSPVTQGNSDSRSPQIPSICTDEIGQENLRDGVSLLSFFIFFFSFCSLLCTSHLPVLLFLRHLNVFGLILLHRRASMLQSVPRALNRRVFSHPRLHFIKLSPQSRLRA